MPRFDHLVVGAGSAACVLSTRLSVEGYGCTVPVPGAAGRFRSCTLVRTSSAEANEGLDECAGWLLSGRSQGASESTLP